MSRKLNILALVMVSSLLALSMYQNAVIQEQRRVMAKIADTYCGKVN